jgi:hypothetical protein
MSPPSTTAQRRTAVARIPLITLLLACLGLAACGGSSSTTAKTTGAAAASSSSAATGTTTTTATTTGTTTATTGTGTTTSPSTTAAPGVRGPRGALAGRFAALRKCMAKEGVKLPTSGGGSGFGGSQGGSKLPKGVTRTQFDAAVDRCGGFPGGPRGDARGPNSPAFQKAMTRFAQCLRQNGIDVPEPNTSGKGPIFDTKGLDTGTPKFRTAAKKCRSTLLAGLDRGRPGSGSSRVRHR